MTNKKKAGKKTQFESRFTCYECAITFKVFGVMTHKRNKAPFCPNCGENTDVERENSIRKSDTKSGKIPWTPEENALIERYLKGELSPEQIRIKTGRTHASVFRRCAHAKEQQEKERARNDSRCAV